MGFAQELLNLGIVNSNINFEDTIKHKYIAIDTQNIWQIDKPEKVILFLPPSSPYLGEKVIFTDTSKYYTSNIESSFQFILYLGEGNTYKILLEHKFDFEPNKDGGII